MEENQEHPVSKSSSEVEALEIEAVIPDFYKYLENNRIKPTENSEKFIQESLMKVRSYFFKGCDLAAVEECLAKYKEDLDEDFAAYLHTLRQYVNSRDCPFINRYQKHHYFFNDVVITRKSEELQAFNTHMDQLIAGVHSPPTRSLSNQVFSLGKKVPALMISVVCVLWRNAASATTSISSASTVSSAVLPWAVFSSFISQTHPQPFFKNSSSDKLIETEFLAYPSSLPKMGVSETRTKPKDKKTHLVQFKNQTILVHPEPWWSVLFNRREQENMNWYEHASSYKTDDLLSYLIYLRTINDKETKKLIADYSSRVEYYGPQVQEYMLLTLSYMPELQIEFNWPFVFQAEEPKGSGIYFYHENRISMAYPPKLSSSIPGMVYSLSTACDVFTAQILAPDVRGTEFSPKPFFPQTKEEEKSYKTLWAIGDKRIQSILQDAKRIYEIKGGPKTSTAIQEVASLQEKSLPYRRAAQILLDNPVFADEDFYRQLIMSEEYIADLKNKFGIDLKVGKTVNLNGLMGVTGSIPEYGQLEIVHITSNKKGAQIIQVKILDPLVRSLCLYVDMQNKVAETPLRFQDTAKLAYARRYFPGNLFKMIWKEVYEYHAKQLALVKEKLLERHIEIRVNANTKERYSQLAQGMREKGLVPQKTKISEKEGEDYITYAAMAMLAGDFVEAHRALDILNKNRLLVTQCQEVEVNLHFLEGNYSKAIESYRSFSRQWKPVWYLTDYAIGVAALKIGELSLAREQLTLTKSKGDSFPIDERLTELFHRQWRRAMTVTKGAALEEETEGISATTASVRKPGSLSS